MTLPFQPAGAFPVPSNVILATMRSADEARVHALHAVVFGPGRYARTAFRLREKAAPLVALSYVAEEDGVLIGAVSMSRVAVGEARGVLLGPLAVLPQKRDLGVGKALLARAVASAFSVGESFVLLVGDLPYYAPVGFTRVPFGQMVLPGPVDPSRLLIATNPEAMVDVPAGAVRGRA